MFVAQTIKQIMDCYDSVGSGVNVSLVRTAGGTGAGDAEQDHQHLPRHGLI
jgi:hypothetical protein